MPTPLAVTGTPGIGKSWFLYYLLLRLLKLTKPPPFIVLEHLIQPGKAVRLVLGVVRILCYALQAYQAPVQPH